MTCPKCGAVLPSADAECTHCAVEANRPSAPSLDSSDPPPPAPRPFAQITPYSGPYPPNYIQVSSSESRPGPTNVLTKWIGLLWSAAIPICIVLELSGATTDRIGDPIGASGERVSLPVWILLWAIVAVPCCLLFRHTRPKK